MEVRETPRGWGIQAGAGSGARAGSTAAPSRPGGRIVRASLPGSPRTPGHSPLPRPAAAQQPVPPARLTTEPCFGAGLRPSSSRPGSCPTSLSASLQPAPRVGVHAAESGPGGRAAQGASDPGGRRCYPTPFRIRANRLGSQVSTRVRKSVLLVWDESVLTASLCCARGLPPVPVPPSFHCHLCLGGKKSRTPFSLKHEKQVLIMDRKSDLDSHVYASE